MRYVYSLVQLRLVIFKFIITSCLGLTNSATVLWFPWEYKGVYYVYYYLSNIFKINTIKNLVKLMIIMVIAMLMSFVFNNN